MRYGSDGEGGIAVCGEEDWERNTEMEGLRDVWKGAMPASTCGKGEASLLASVQSVEGVQVSY